VNTFYQRLHLGINALGKLQNRKPKAEINDANRRYMPKIKNFPVQLLYMEALGKVYDKNQDFGPKILRPFDNYI